jgi:hypothetical protein
VVVEQETVTYMENERSIEVAATRKEAPKARLSSLQLLTLPRPLRPHRLPQPWWMKNIAGKRTLQYISNPYRLYLGTYFSSLKFIYSKKVTKFCEISMVDLSYVVPVKSKVEISQNIVAFSEYMNFKK